MKLKDVSKIDAGIENSIKGKVDGENKSVEFEMTFKAHFKGETPDLQLLLDVAVPLVTKTLPLVKR